MLKKRQRLTNLNHTRAEIAGQLQQLMAEHQLQIDKFAQLTSWTPFYLQALLEGRANPNIGEAPITSLRFLTINSKSNS